MTENSWSLARRMTLGFVTTTVVLLLVISSIGAWFLRESVQNELDALVIEELDEVEAILSGREISSDIFQELADDLASKHPETAMAWRLWREGSMESWEYGEVSLFAGRQLDSELSHKPRRLSSTLRWKVTELYPEMEQPPYLAGLLLDGKAELAVLRRYGWSALILILISAVLASLGGGLFANRISSMLKRISRDARAAADLEDTPVLIPDSYPEEVREVAIAFRDTLNSIREESQRASLLITGMAHELRSPLQNLLAETDVLAMRERSSEEYKAALSSIGEELHDLGRVIDNLVTLCASTKRSDVLVLEDFDLAEESELRLVRERRLASKRGLQFALSATGDLRMRGDREAIVLVLRNLVGNAIEWSPEGATVGVRLEGDGRAVTLTVDDQGPGIPAAERERIFDAFYRGPGRDGHRAGYGLGLALTRVAVQRHAGTVEVSSSPSGGARFQVVLPRMPKNGERPST